jgi:hypothetical protein
MKMLLVLSSAFIVQLVFSSFLIESKRESQSWMEMAAEDTREVEFDLFREGEAGDKSAAKQKAFWPPPNDEVCTSREVILIMVMMFLKKISRARTSGSSSQAGG